MKKIEATTGDESKSKNIEVTKLFKKSETTTKGKNKNEVMREASPGFGLEKRLGYQTG